MKNRRIVVVAIMLAAVLCLGVGYAALQETLTATGKVNVTIFDVDWKADSAAGFSPVINDANDTLTFTVPDTVLQEVGDTVTINATIVNCDQRYPANITVNNSVSKDNYTVTVATAADATTVPAGGELAVTITIKLNSMPTVDLVNDEFSFTITAAADET